MTRDLGPWLEDLRASVRPLGDMPLVVLSARGNEPNPPLFKPEQDAALAAEGHRGPRDGGAPFDQLGARDCRPFGALHPGRRAPGSSSPP